MASLVHRHYISSGRFPRIEENDSQDSSKKTMWRRSGASSLVCVRQQRLSQQPNLIIFIIVIYYMNLNKFYIVRAGVLTARHTAMTYDIHAPQITCV